MEDIFITDDILNFLNLEIISKEQEKVERINTDVDKYLKELKEQQGNDCYLKFRDSSKNIAHYKSNIKPFDTLQDLKNLLYVQLHTSSAGVVGLHLSSEENNKIKEAIRKIDLFSRLQNLPINDISIKSKNKI